MNEAITVSAQSSALINTEGQRAQQEVQAALVIAKRFPRNVKDAIDRILNACTRKNLAAQAVYCYSRGGSDISGPSIRLAEAVAQQWGNLQFGIRELEQRDGESTVEAFAWDLETNVREVKVFQVRHERDKNEKINGKSTGNKVKSKLTDSRDIYELVANQGARRLRSCILGVIPGDIIEDAVRQCEVTMAADADTSPEAQKNIISKFSEFGVTKEQIEAKIQRRMDAIQPAQVIQLRKIFNSMKDGMSVAADWFDAPSKPEQAEPVNPFEQKPEPKPEAKGELL